MPFIESSESARAKLHLSDASPPLVWGIALLATCALGLFIFNMVSAPQGFSFTPESTQTSNQKAFVLSSTEGSDVAPSDIYASDTQSDALSSQTRGSDGQSDVAGVGDSASANTQEEGKLYVFVSGEVLSPGVYVLDAGARVNDAVEAAGGFSEAAATDAINLARPLSDGEQVDILSEEEAAEIPLEALQQEEVLNNVSNTSEDVGITSTGIVNLNTADAAQLETLPGIGPATAAKIVASRESEGPFASVSDLSRVSGIGEKKLAALEGLVCV